MCVRMLADPGGGAGGQKERDKEEEEGREGGRKKTYRTQNTQFLVFSLKMARKNSSKCSTLINYLQFLCYNEKMYIL